MSRQTPSMRTPKRRSWEHNRRFDSRETRGHQCGVPRCGILLGDLAWRKDETDRGPYDRRLAKDATCSPHEGRFVDGSACGQT